MGEHWKALKTVSIVGGTHYTSAIVVMAQAVLWCLGVVALFSACSTERPLSVPQVPHAKVALETGQTGDWNWSVRVVASSLLATKKVEWLTASRVLRSSRVLHLVAAPGLAPLLRFSPTEANEGNEASWFLRSSANPPSLHHPLPGTPHRSTSSLGPEVLR
jgi:hypothetical protein